MLAQIATALLAFASHHKLEDAKEAPTKSVYATAGTSGAGADPSKRCSEGQHEGMNMDKAACRAACIATSGCTHAIHFSDNGCQISTKGCTLVSHGYGADTDEIFARRPPNPCICKEQWSGVELSAAPATWHSEYDARCAAQSGCPDAACDGDTAPWCRIENPGCDGEESGQGWAYCDPQGKTRLVSEKTKLIDDSTVGKCYTPKEMAKRMDNAEIDPFAWAPPELGWHTPHALKPYYANFYSGTRACDNICGVKCMCDKETNEANDYNSEECVYLHRNGNTRYRGMAGGSTDNGDYCLDRCIDNPGATCCAASNCVDDVCLWYNNCD